MKRANRSPRVSLSHPPVSDAGANGKSGCQQLVCLAFWGRGEKDVPNLCMVERMGVLCKPIGSACWREAGIGRSSMGSVLARQVGREHGVNRAAVDMAGISMSVVRLGMDVDKGNSHEPERQPRQDHSP